MKRKRITKKERRQVFEMCNGRCGYCGKEITFKDMQVDHVFPLHRGGLDAISNMMPSCASCNHRKGTETVESFRKSIEKFPAVLARSSVTYRNAVRFGVVTPTPHKVIFYFERMEGQK